MFDDGCSAACFAVTDGTALSVRAVECVFVHRIGTREGERENKTICDAQSTHKVNKRERKKRSNNNNSCDDSKDMVRCIKDATCTHTAP